MGLCIYLLMYLCICIDVNKYIYINAALNLQTILHMSMRVYMHILFSKYFDEL